jgi:hypothetical protein
LSIENLLHSGEETPAAGRQDPPFGVGKGRIERECQFLEARLEGVEAGGDLFRAVSEWRGVLVRGQRRGGAGIPEQGLLRGGVRSDAERPEEGLGLPGGEAMARDGVGELLLLAGRKCAQGEGHGESDATLIEGQGERRGELLRKDESALHEGPLAVEELRDGRGRQAVFLIQRGDDPCLVHGARRPPRRVGLEEAGLAGGPRDLLHHDRDLEEPFGLPLREALEAVEDGEGAVGLEGRSQRQRGERTLAVRTLPAQWRERRAQLGERHERDRAHATVSVTGRSWKSG